MNVILLSGGSGKRLWPLSNEIRSKQFLKLFSAENGETESMVQRVYRQIMAANPASTVTIATGKQQKSAVLHQLGEKVGLCIEPSRRDTFPAIALSCAYLYSEQNISPEDAVIVCPVDPYVEQNYFSCLQQLEKNVYKNTANLTLMGVCPTYPSQKYGYIIPEQGEEPVKKVREFREKPDEEAAKSYIEQGALWNCGVFAFRLGYLLKILKKYIPYTSYKDVYEQYGQLPCISFDYAVVEKEPSIQCIAFNGSWKDIGTWNTLSEVMSEPILGNAILGNSCENIHIINELEIPILAMGCKNMMIAASPDGILVSDKHQSSFIKPFVDNIEQRVMYEEKSWGEFQILHLTPYSMTVKLEIQSGRALSRHLHHNRKEIWTVLKGQGIAIINDKKISLIPGSTLQIPREVPHSLQASTAMQLIEIQIGDKLEDKDFEEC